MTKKFYGYDDLSPEQKEDADWLLEPLADGCHHKYLANVMGLGKTVVACVALSKIAPASAQLSGLIICPANIKDGYDDEATAWKQQLIRWSCVWRDDIQVITSGADYPGAPIVIVNPEMLVRSQPLQRALARRTFDFCIVDEAHRLKGLNSKITDLVLCGGAKALIARAKYKWLMSGSAMPNRAIELFPAIRALAPDLIKPYITRDDYARYFCGGFFDGHEVTASGTTNESELADRLKPFMRRRLHAENALPPVFERDVSIDIGDIPLDDSNTTLATLRKYIGDAKIPHTVAFVKDTFQVDKDKRVPDKIIIFTYHQSVTLDLVKQLSQYHAVSYFGGISAKQKAANLKTFKTDYRCRVLVAQMGSAGEGIDGLQLVCSDIIYAEEDWTEEYVGQQIARVHRRGQINDVYVTHLIASGTMDDKIVRARIKKGEKVKSFWSGLIEPDNGEVNLHSEDIMIEEIMKEVIAALDRNTAALKAFSLNAAEVAEAPKSNGRKTAKKEAAPAPETSAGAAPPVETLAPVTVPSSDDVVKCAMKVLAALTQGSADEAICGPARARVRAAVDPVVGASVSVSAIPEDKRAAVIEALEGVDLTPIQPAKAGLGI